MIKTILLKQHSSIKFFWLELSLKGDSQNVPTDSDPEGNQKSSQFLKLIN